MRVSFHEDPVTVADLCADLRDDGAVYWHTSRPNFRAVAKLIEAQGLRVLALCARPDGDFLNFLVRLDLCDANPRLTEERVADAIARWMGKGEPVPHSEPL